MNLFTTHYIAKHNGRKLNWLHQQHGRVEIKLLYTDKKYELTMTLLQFLVLSAFESNQTNTVSDVVRATGLVDKEEVDRLVKSLVDSQLLKGAKSEDDAAGTTFALNFGFSR